MNEPKILKIGGAEYPCQQTMGALRIFHSEVGHDIEADLGKMSTQDFFVYIYACCKSASRKLGKAFPYSSYEDFADDIPIESVKQVLTDFLAILTADTKESGGGGGDGSKKNSPSVKPTE